jgi:hypothetical protein
MATKHSPRGVVLAGLLAAAIAGGAGGAAMGAAVQGRPQEPPGPNPAAQRAEMIRLLKSIDERVRVIQEYVEVQQKKPPQEG